MKKNCVTRFHKKKRVHEFFASSMNLCFFNFVDNMIKLETNLLLFCI